jgi:hypothetical protein
MKSLIACIEDFAATVGEGPGWKKFSAKQLRSDPELLQNIFDMLSGSYTPIGGHASYKNPADLIDAELVFYGTDVDGDGDAEAFTIGKKAPAGEKSVAGGSDGTPPGKTAYVSRQAEQLKKRGFYSEMSGAIAHLMLKAGAKPVRDKVTVEKVLGKTVKWYGAHPDGKYPDVVGWYERSIGGHDHLKIMLGIPNVPAPKKEPAKVTVQVRR